MNILEVITKKIRAREENIKLCTEDEDLAHTL